MRRGGGAGGAGNAGNDGGNGYGGKGGAGTRVLSAGPPTYDEFGAPGPGSTNQWYAGGGGGGGQPPNNTGGAGGSGPAQGTPYAGGGDGGSHPGGDGDNGQASVVVEAVVLTQEAVQLVVVDQVLLSFAIK